MKKPFQWVLTSLFVLALAACGAKSAEAKDNSNSETQAPATAETADNSAADKAPTSIDVQAFGFKGAVKEALYSSFFVADVTADVLVAEDEIDNEGEVEKYCFDKAGRVTVDPWGGIYAYDGSGNFVKGVTAKSKMQRDDKGRVSQYSQANDDEDDAMFHNTFTYDAQGRIAKVERAYWEMTIEEKFTYEGDNPYPARREFHKSDVGTEVESTTDYRYTKFDEQGNWTERELRVIGTETEEGEEDYPTRWTNALIERRAISYY